MIPVDIKANEHYHKPPFYYATIRLKIIFTLFVPILVDECYAWFHLY